MSRLCNETWLFDLGNTRLKWAAMAADGGVGEMQALAHGGNAQQLAAAALPHVAVACVSSVAAPGLRDALLEALTQRLSRIHVARTLQRCGRLEIAYPAPERLGVDRFLSLLAVSERRAPALVVSVGTALTIDLLDADGRHHGGRIAPSPQLMREALHARASQLPAEGGAYAEFASDTTNALVSGCEGAALGLVERSLIQAETQLGTRPKLLLHGGGAEALAPRLPEASIEPGLVLAGLAQWARIGDTAP